MAFEKLRQFNTFFAYFIYIFEILSSWQEEPRSIKTEVQLIVPEALFWPQPIFFSRCVSTEKLDGTGIAMLKLHYCILKKYFSAVVDILWQTEILQLHQKGRRRTRENLGINCNSGKGTREKKCIFTSQQLLLLLLPSTGCTVHTRVAGYTAAAEVLLLLFLLPAPVQLRETYNDAAFDQGRKEFCMQPVTCIAPRS